MKLLLIHGRLPAVARQRAGHWLALAVQKLVHEARWPYQSGEGVLRHLKRVNRDDGHRHLQRRHHEMHTFEQKIPSSNL